MENSDDHIKSMETRILRDAEEKAQKIIAEAEKEAENMISQVQGEMEELEQTENKAIKERVEESKRKILAEQKTEHIRRIQAYKTEIIDSVFDKTLQKLKEYIETERYNEELKKLVVEAGICIGGGELEISVNDRDRQIIDQKFLKEIAENITEQTEIKTHLKLTNESVNSLGGALVSKIGENATVDNTFEERLNRKRKKISGELENILFR